MDLQQLVTDWFEKWETGDFLNLPIAEDFQHTSPYGTISGKKEYIRLVEANKQQFLGYRFEIQDAFYGIDRACVRYSAIKQDFRLEVSEWHYGSQGKIDRIVAYYNIEGEISEERQLAQPDP